jgi:acetyl-CoA acetyltransferase
MPTAVIVDAVRTAGGKRNGKLSGWHPADLAAETLDALVKRNDLDPALVDDVIMGCVMQAGGQSLNVGRNAVLAAGWPEEVPSTTVDRQCGSSQQAAHFAAQAVMAGAHDIVVAAGVEVMSQVPMGASIGDGKFGFPFGPKVNARYADVGGLVPQGISAELIADKWGLSREDLDASAPRARPGPPGPRPRAASRTRSSPCARSTVTRRPATSASPTSWSPPTRASARARPPRRSPT